MRLGNVKATALSKAARGYGGLDFRMMDTSFSKGYVSTKTVHSNST